MSLLDLPHHDGSELYVSNPYPRLGERVTVFARVPHDAGVRAVHVRTVPDGEPHYDAAVIDGQDDTQTWWRASIEVHNPVLRYRFLLDRGDLGYRWLNAAGVHAHDVVDATDFRLTAYGAPPAWARNATAYQIYPDRFAHAGPPAALPSWAVPADWDSPVSRDRDVQARQVFGGNLPGIEAHLDHIAALGMDTVYLTPFFPAGSSHRYDARSFAHVDPLLGGDAALARLSQALHARGMHLIGDLTTNHTGDKHEWHQAARQDPDSPEASFYYWHNHPDDYVSWLGVRTLPKLNYNSAELTRRMVDGRDSVVAKWLQPPYSLDGWRIDVANMTGRYRDDDFTTSVARAVRRTMVDVNPEALLIAEHAHDATADLTGDGWHGTMNYAGFTRPVWAWLGDEKGMRRFPGVPAPSPRWTGGDVVTTMRLVASAMPWSVVTQNFNLVGSHDTARIRTVVGDPAKVEVAAGLLFTMTGVPMTFAGDEIGLEGTDGEDARRPMPWHRPDAWDTRTLQVYRDLATLRRSSEALRQGGLRWAHVGDDALAFLRETSDERLLVLAARRPHDEVVLGCDALGISDDTENLYGGAQLRVSSGKVTLPADGPSVQVWRLG